MNPELHSKTSEYREHSQKSQSSGKVTDEETSRNIVHQMLERHVHSEDSENREHSQNLQVKQVVQEIGRENVTVGVRENQCSAGDSDFPKHSQNSLSKGEPKVDPGEANVSFNTRDGHCWPAASELRELSSNSQVETGCSQGTTHKQSMKLVCVGEPSEY